MCPIDFLRFISFPGDVILCWYHLLTIPVPQITIHLAELCQNVGSHHDESSHLCHSDDEFLVLFKKADAPPGRLRRRDKESGQWTW